MMVFEQTSSGSLCHFKLIVGWSVGRSVSQSVSQSVRPSWRRDPSGIHDQILIVVNTVAVFFVMGRPACPED
jgi:hypothetical protein